VPGRYCGRVHVDSIFRAIGRFAVKFRWVVLLVWVVAAVAIPSALPSLASVTQGNNTSFLPASAPSNEAATLAAPLGLSLKVTPVPVVAAVSTGTLTPADQAWLTTLQADLGKVSTVTSVRALGDSAVPGPNGVAGQAAQIQVLSDVSTTDQTAITNFVDALRSTITGADPPAGLQVHLTGQVAIAVDQQKQSGNTGSQLQTVAAAFILILLLLIFRSIFAPFITLIPAYMSVSIAGPIIGELADHGLKVSSLSQLLLIVLVIGAGTDYGLFLVFRVRENILKGQDPREATVNALTKVGESITFSALTVIAALLSLLSATFQIYSNLGIPLAIGIGVMLLAGLTLLPALLAITGRWAFFPSQTFWVAPKTPIARYAPLWLILTLVLKPVRWVLNLITFGGLLKLWRWWGNRARTKAAAAKTGGRQRLGWGRIAASVVKRPAASLLIGVIVFGALSSAVVAYQSGGFGGQVTAPAGTDSAAGTNLLNKYFPVSAANPTNLVFKLSSPAWTPSTAAAIEAATAQLSKDAVFSAVNGPLNPVGTTGLTPTVYAELHNALGSGTLPATVPPLPAAVAQLGITAAQWPQDYQLFRASSQFVSADGETIVYNTSLSAGDPSTTAAMNATPAARTATTAAAATLHATANGVTGEAPALYDISSISNSDLMHVIPIAIVVIGLLLALVMRSLVAPLYLIASVALSYFAALGLAVIVFIKIGGSGGITFILPFLLFIFLLALGEDYNILVMTRIREEAKTMPLRDAVARAVGVTGTTVTSAGLVLAGTFAVFAIVGGGGSGGSEIVDIGLGLAVGVIMDTFVVRTVLVPCTVVLLGRWNWWPSKLHMTADAVGASADGLGLADTANSAASSVKSGDSESHSNS
jgi:putative drug exporter of the RND superfamily